MKKCPSSLWCWDSNPWPSGHESPPITTRPGLPPNCAILSSHYFYCRYQRGYNFQLLKVRQPIFRRFLLRYKMLSKKTWPNIRTSEEEAVRTILTEQGLIKDAVFGKTKIFITSPETLFHLVKFTDSWNSSVIGEQLDWTRGRIMERIL